MIDSIFLLNALLVVCMSVIYLVILFTKEIQKFLRIDLTEFAFTSCLIEETKQPENLKNIL